MKNSDLMNTPHRQLTAAYWTLNAADSAAVPGFPLPGDRCTEIGR